MSLLKQIVSDKLAAKKLGNSTETTILGVLQGEVELESSKMIKVKVDGVKKDVKRDPLTDDDIIKIVRKIISSNNEVIKASEGTNRNVNLFVIENSILDRYVPKLKVFTEDEIRELVSNEVNALPEDQRNKKSMGAVMKSLSKHGDGIDKRFASSVVKELLD